MSKDSWERAQEEVFEKFEEALRLKVEIDDQHEVTVMEWLRDARPKLYMGILKMHANANDWVINDMVELVEGGASL
jgi:hypothetical protein